MEFFSAKKLDKRTNSQGQKSQEERFIPTSEFHTPDLSKMTFVDAGLTDQELLGRLDQELLGRSDRGDGFPTWRDVDDSPVYKRQQWLRAQEECAEKLFNSKTDGSPKTVVESGISSPVMR